MGDAPREARMGREARTGRVDMPNTLNTSTPSPPFYTIPNINNLRDAALHPLITKDGHPLRTHILFRSASVAQLTQPDWTQLAALGVNHVFDLRSAPEVTKGWAGVTGEAARAGDFHPEWMSAMSAAGVQRSWVPVFPEADYSPERLAERYVMYMDERVDGFVGAYKDILSNAGDAYRTILLYLANLPPPSEGASHDDLAAENRGALVHCTAGKDRTGIFFGVLFDFLGVDRESIAGEYQRTEDGLAHVREEVVGRLMLSPGFGKYMAEQMSGSENAITAEDISAALQAVSEGQTPPVEIPADVLEKGRAAARRMIGARKESMLGALEMVDREFGGSEKYLREKCGLGDEQLEALRRNLVFSKVV